MSTTVPLPRNLRPDLIRRIESMTEDELQLVHSVLLHAEKQRLWSEISDDAEKDYVSGSFKNLPHIIAQARKEIKQ